MQRKSSKKYYQSEKGKEMKAKLDFVRCSSLIPKHFTLKTLGESREAYKRFFNIIFDEDIFGET